MENSIKGKCILWGVVGGVSAPINALVCAALLTACFMGADDPNGFVTAIAAASLFIGGWLSGFVSVKKGELFICSVITAVIFLFVLAFMSVFVPQSNGLLERILPPLLAALSPLLGGYLGTLKQSNPNKKIKKAMKKRIKG